MNSQTIKDARQSLHNGEKISACDKCWTNESAGKKSLRQIYNVEFAKYFDFSKLNDQWTVSDLAIESNSCPPKSSNKTSAKKFSSKGSSIKTTVSIGAAKTPE
jgi:hypothetical protein